MLLGRHMASGNHGSSPPRPVVTVNRWQGPTTYRRSIRLGPTSSSSTGHLASQAAGVNAPATRWQRVASGSATARAAGPAAFATLCQQGENAPVVAGTGERPGQSAPMAPRIAQAAGAAPPVWRPVLQAPPRSTLAPAAGALTARRSRGTTSAYPLSSAGRPWTSSPQAPEGWHSLLQAAREWGSTRSRAELHGHTASVPSLVSRNALRALEAMVQDVDDFGSEDGTCSICLGSDSTQVVELKCGNRHRFHKSCINTWMVASLAVRDGTPRCPLCRKGLSMGQGSRRNVLDLSLQELVAVERLLEDVRVAVIEQRSMMEQRLPGEGSPDSGAVAADRPDTRPLRAAQLRALMLEDRVAELRSAVYDLQSRLSLL